MFVYTGPGIRHVVSIEDAARAELGSLSAELRSSALAETALELARRLDAGPGDREAVGLARELRLSLGELHRGTEDTTDDVEAFLERIATPDVGHTAN
jgi:hypothetical protein